MSSSSSLSTTTFEFPTNFGAFLEGFLLTGSNVVLTAFESFGVGVCFEVKTFRKSVRSSAITSSGFETSSISFGSALACSNAFNCLISSACCFTSSSSSLSSNDFLNITRLQSYICFFYYASIGSILLIVGIIIINIFFL